jgi:hypothetical protein
MPMVLLYALLAAGTALTNSNTETVLGSYEFPAHFFQAGKVVQFEALVRSTATNATDTLVVRVRFGATTLTGTALITTATVDQANDDICVVRGTLICRDADSSSGLVFLGGGNDADATGQAARNFAAILSSVDTTGALKLEVTGTWSVANAGNSCQLEALNIYEGMPSDVS